MIEDVRRVEAFVAGLSREQFVKDERTVFAVAYAFIRLGEAVATIPEHVKAAHPGVPWGDIRHFRNFMIHVYHGVDYGRVFDTAVTDVAGLASALLTVQLGSVQQGDNGPA